MLLVIIQRVGIWARCLATISMVDLPAGAKPTIDRDFVIANIQAPSGLASQSDDEEGEGGEEAEGEATEEAEAEE